MICNLNHLSFQNYGTIESERVAARDLLGKAAQSCVMELTNEERRVYRCAQEIWVRNHENMTVLSVSVDGDSYEHFYLDKIICINPGVYFSLHPYQQTSSVELAGECMLTHAHAHTHTHTETCVVVGVLQKNVKSPLLLQWA